MFTVVCLHGGRHFGATFVRDLRRILVAFAALLLLATAGSVQAACTRDAYGAVRCSDGLFCMATRSGEIGCAREAGGIAINHDGEARCGAGQCVVDAKGDVHCSSLVGGGAGLDSRGVAVCDEGCRPGSGTVCSMPR